MDHRSRYVRYCQVPEGKESWMHAHLSLQMPSVRFHAEIAIRGRSARTPSLSNSSFSSCERANALCLLDSLIL